MPLAYLDKIKAVPGVTQVTYSNWFRGIYKDQSNFFAKFAIDPDDYFKVYPEIEVAPADLAAFRADRTGCLIGEDLAKKYGFKKGDLIKVKGDIYPGDWAFTVDGILHDQELVRRTRASTSSGSIWTAACRRRAVAGSGPSSFWSRTPTARPRSAKAVDALFQSSANETHTESEQAFILGFVTSSQAIVAALQAVSFALLFIMLLIMGNTLAMALRERTGELAVMRTLGFRPRAPRRAALLRGVLAGARGRPARARGLLLRHPQFMAILGGFLSPDSVRSSSGAGAFRRWVWPSASGFSRA